MVPSYSFAWQMVKTMQTFPALTGVENHRSSFLELAAIILCYLKLA